MANSIARLTMYGLISAMEQDLRDAVFNRLDGQLSDQELLGESLHEKAALRLRNDEDFGSESATLDALLLYTDFGDLIQVLARHRNLFGTELAKRIKDVVPQLERITPIRNRVMHSRPLNFDDLVVVTELADELASDADIVWNRLRQVIAETRADPSSVLTLEIPVWENETAYHNLPTPDFDETGFIGRGKTVEQVISACLGAFPVVTIVGEGGIGKTALAVKVAYDILDRDDNPFEAVVFTTAKTTQLNAQEIRRIEHAISTSLGMLEDVAEQIAGESQDPFDDVLAQLRDFRILLVLDNLETVLDDRIRNFLSSLPRDSKVLITSRIGVGAFEYPVKLTPLEDDEAVQLLRAVARARDVNKLVATANKQLVAYCKRMHNNPLHIKWFVSAVQTGRRPEEVLSNEKLFLEFCMSNVYDYLSSDSRFVLRALLCVGGSYTLAELAFLTSLDDLVLQRAVQQLMTTNMLSMSSVPTGNSYETRYELGQLARSYLSKMYPATREEHQQFMGVKRALFSAGEEIRAGYTTNPTSAFNVQVRTRSDWVIAKYLLDALEKTRRREYDAAEELVTRARNLAPDYFEVYRVHAWLHAAQHNFTEANLSYEAAIDLEPNSLALRLLYGGFLLRELQDTDAALVQYRQAERIDPTSFDVKLELARAFLYRRDFEQARTNIDELFNQTGLAERARKKVQDLTLGFYQRIADHYATQQAPARAVGYLEDLRAVFEGLADPDERMRQKLLKAAGTARVCLRMLQDTETEQRAIAILQWLSLNAGPPRAQIDLQIGRNLSGVIQDLPLHEQYGFIRLPSGQSLYFHRAGLSDAGDWPRMFVGQHVLLTVGENAGGICAIDVRVDAAAGNAAVPKPGDIHRGAVLRMPPDQNFGFLRADAGPEYFFHKSAVEPPSDWFNLRPGDRVEFTHVIDTQGRTKAANVKLQRQQDLGF